MVGFAPLAGSAKQWAALFQGRWPPDKWTGRTVPLEAGDEECLPLHDDPAPFAIAIAEDFPGSKRRKDVGDLIALAFPDAAQDESMFRPAPYDRSGWDEDSCQDVRTHHIGGAAAASFGLQDIVAVEPNAILLQPVQRRVGRGRAHAIGIVVKGGNVANAQFRPGDGQDAAASAGIQ